VVAEDGAKVLKIVTSKELLEPPATFSRREVTVRLQLPGMGLSLVGDDEEEGRREIAFLFFRTVHVEYVKGTRELDLEVKIGQVQLDNHVAKCIFPVIFCPRTMKADQPFIHFSVLMEADPMRPGSNIVRYGIRLTNRRRWMLTPYLDSSH